MAALTQSGLTRVVALRGDVSLRRRPCRAVAAPARAAQRGEERPADPATGRRELLLNSSSALVLASLLNFSGTRPSGLGVSKFAGAGALGLCPRTPNCISTAEEANDPGHYVPPWTYNPEESKRGRNPVSQEQAMQELVAAVKASSPDGFTPTIVKQEEDYLYVEYQSPLFGFVDDVEFYFPGGPGSRVEYRSASRMGNTDGDINRKRIKALREALQKSGWKSIGY